MEKLLKNVVRLYIIRNMMDNSLLFAYGYGKI